MGLIQHRGRGAQKQRVGNKTQIKNGEKKNSNKEWEMDPRIKRGERHPGKEYGKEN